jgi:hypothetical protein
MRRSGELHPTKLKPDFAVALGDRVNSTSQSQNRALRGLRVIERLLLLIRAVLREIFDESAYERFLSRTQDSRSVASYRDFIHEREAAMVKKPRCC